MIAPGRKGLASLDHMAAAEGECAATPFLEMAQTASERLLTLVDDMLDLSRIEAGKLSIRKEPFALRPLADSILRMFAVKAGERGLVLKYFVEPEVPEVLCGDPDRLGQVLVNLIGNSIKFTEAGEVEVTVRKIDSQHIQFDVRDTGIGIPADKMHLLFQRFSQVDTARARKYGGTGLGLALSKQIVEAMGGAVWAKSTEGELSSLLRTHHVP